LNINEKAPPRDGTQRGTFSYEYLILAEVYQLSSG